MLNLFEKLNIDDKDLHRKYLILRDILAYTGEQSILNDWVDGFQDRDNKIIKEFQTTFHSSFWEFYLFALFKEAGFEIDFTKNRPDFFIRKPFLIYIEAVVSNIKQNGKKEEERTPEDVLSMIEPYPLQEDFDTKMREAITRYSSAILSKSVKFIDYSKDNEYDINAPYVIALGGFDQLNYGNNFYFPMYALLYGKYYDNLNDKYEKKENILKPNTESSIPIGLFLNKKMEHVSAIIFSCTLTLGKLTSLAISQEKCIGHFNSVLCIRYDMDPPHYKLQLISPTTPEYLSDGVFIFHNPFAKNPLPENLFEKTNVVNIKFDPINDILFEEGNKLPIVSRLNLPYGKHFFIQDFLEEIFNSLNPDMLYIKAIALSIEEVDDGKGFDVEFKDVDDDFTFTLWFDSEAIDKYKVAEGQEFLFAFQLKRNSIKSVDGFKLYLKLKKSILTCNQDEIRIIDIKNISLG